MSELLAEIIEALEEAATEERPMRIGYEAARVLHAALVDASAVKQAHEHVWQPLGFHANGREAVVTDSEQYVTVVMACSCGDVSARRARDTE